MGVCESKKTFSNNCNWEFTLFRMIYLHIFILIYFIIPRYYTWNRSKFYVPIGKNEFPIWLSVSFRDEIISAFTYLSLFSTYYIWIDEILIIFVFRRKRLLHYNKKKLIWESVTKTILLYSICIPFSSTSTQLSISYKKNSNTIHTP